MKEGKIVEHWGVLDQLGLLLWLDLMPRREPAPVGGPGRDAAGQVLA